MGTAFYGCEYGKLRISEDDGAIVGIVCDVGSLSRLFLCGERSDLTDRAFCELCEYFDGMRRTFDLPIRADGSDFQKAVWREITAIPYGKVRTYGEIAKAVGSPGASRAVGMAAHRNPIWIVIPCHRVIGAGGRLTGYAGGLDMKAALLDMEKRRAGSF